jgi:DNA polymerase III epsilon subunit-like protein
MPWKISKQRKAFVDVETTGLDPQTHEMIEFAVVYEDNKTVSFKIQPRRMDKASPEALKINGYTPEKWQEALPLDRAASQIANALQNCILVGHNVKFDMGFIQALLKEANVKARLGYHTIDTVTLAYEHLAPCGIDSLSLKNVCIFLGIPPEPDEHQAGAGAMACKQVYEKLARATWLARLRWRYKNRKR